MSNPTQQIRQMAQNLFKAKSGSSQVKIKILHPKRDWFIGIGVACCIVVGITVWNGYTYLSNREGGSTDIELTIANPRYQTELVDEALNVFDTRATNFAAIANGMPSVPVTLPESTVPEVGTSTATSTSESSEVLSVELEQGSDVDQPVEPDLVEVPELETEPTTEEDTGTLELSQ